jgi:hypothetical protein
MQKNAHCAKDPMSSENQIELLEKEVDRFFSSLAIRHYPRNLAAWAVVTKAAIEVQRAAASEYGGAKHRHATINFSRVAALLLHEIEGKGNPSFASRQSFQWSPSFDTATHRALTEADGYFHAWANFSFWREKRFKAEANGQSVRFTSEESLRERQVKAFQKSILPKRDRKPPSESLAPMPPYRIELFEKFMAFVGGNKTRTVTYQVPKQLYSELLPWFQSQSEMLVRHREEVCLGRYSVKQIKEFVAALQTVCAVHDHLCFLAAQRRRDFPVNSAVMMMKKDEWVERLTSLSGIDPQALAEIVADLTFGDRVPIDLHSELFVPLDVKGELLAVVPHFGLSARVDENLLRTLSRMDKKAYDTLSEIKEKEMQEDLRLALPNTVSASGPLELPKEAKTNLDLVIVDEADSTVVLIELKWIRKPLFAKERNRADAEFLKGIQQLAKLKLFLESNPTYLKNRGAVSRELSEYRNVHFALVGRDHLVWPTVDPNCLIIEYEVFKEHLRKMTGLHMIVEKLGRYDWLPVEGEDFEIKMDAATVNGITIEGQTYHTL